MAHPVELLGVLSSVPLASIELSVGVAVGAAGFCFGLAALVAAVFAWRRRLAAGEDHPLRSLGPPAGPLRFARDLEMRTTSD